MKKMNKYQLMFEELKNNYICEYIEDYDYDENNISHFEIMINENEIKSLIKELVDKEIPKKLNNLDYNIFKEYDEYYVFGNCPSCGNKISISKENKPKYCCECGQKIDWSEDEKN